MQHEELQDEAIGKVPRGQSFIASVLQQELPGEAIELLPQGHATDASARQPNGDEEGQWQVADEAIAPMLSSSPTAIQELPGEANLVLLQGHLSGASARQPELLSGGHAALASDGQSSNAPAEQLDIAETIAAIRSWHRQRNYVMDQRKRANLALGSQLRTQLGWSPDKTPAERNVIAEQAAALVALGEAEAKGKAVETDEPIYVEWRDVIAATILGRQQFDVIEKRATKEMARLAMTLPVWLSFGAGVKGFGARSLAVIVGEAGDLSEYASKSKLWKRMGVAVMDGKRQGGLSKSASKADWIAHGYNRKRRSHLFVIGDVMIRAADQYWKIYLARKEYERARAVASGLKVAPAAKIPKSRAAEYMSDGHVHRRAQRYMEKRLLRDLWRAWRVDRSAKGILPDEAICRVLTDQIFEEKAKSHVPKEAISILPSPQRVDRSAILTSPSLARPPMLTDQEFEGKATRRLPKEARSTVPSPQSDVPAGL